MSSGLRLPFQEALEVARHLSEDLRPAVVRSKVAGSLRRKRPEVGDIEIVAETHLVAGDLFGFGTPAIGEIRAVLDQWGTVTKAGDRMIQVRDVYGREGLTVDLFLVHPPSQWGSILAIRTGPADLSRLAVTRMSELGYRHRNGFAVARQTGRAVTTPTEEAFFQLAGLPCVPPPRRDELLARLSSRTSHSRRDLNRR